MDLLDGRSVADDEPIIGLDIAEALRGEGATVVSAHNVKTAVNLAATADLSAAVLDQSSR
jgi:CheY-like chemotaxis protein